jgi:hypothetical protein
MLEPVPEGFVELIVRDHEWCSRQILRIDSLDVMGLRLHPSVRAVAEEFSQKVGCFGDAYYRWQAEKDDGT